MAKPATKVVLTKEDFDQIELQISSAALLCLGLVLLATLFSGMAGLDRIAMLGMGMLIGVPFCMAVIFYSLRKVVEVPQKIDIIA